MSLKKKIKSKWFLGINIFIFIIMLLTININTIINMFGGDYKEEKVIEIIDNVGVYDKVQKNIADYSKYNTSSIRVENYDGNEDDLRKYIKVKKNVFGLVIDYDYDNYIKASLIGKNEVSNSIVSAVSNSLNRIRYDMAMSNLGLSQNIINQLNASVKIDNIVLFGEREIILEEGEK